jgi:hypothetical protein
MQARKRGRIPDPTYDFDGDGVVGQLDYFVGRSFDKNCSGHLTPGEKRQAEQALDNGFLDRFVRGLDAQGDVNRAFPIQQKRGVILSGDNACDVSAFTYPQHFNAHHTPKHNTKTALELARLGERKGAGAAIGERYMAANEPVPEPIPPNHETKPRICEISHIRERAEADHQLARRRGGLLPMNSHLNPEREGRSIGLDYDPAPPMATRSQLLETRKEGMRRECEELRNKCNDTQVPLSVRRTAQEVMELEFRRGGDHCMTLTKLKDRRRKDKIEYDMSNFDVHKPKTYPKFSDRPDIPFWVSDGQDSVSGAAPVPPAMPRTLSEPVFKVTEMPFGDDAKEAHHTLPASAHNTAAGLPARVDLTKTSQEQGKTAIGSKTKKRFCAEMIERGQARNMPRLFDRIQPLHTGPRDMESLDVTSAMAPIRENAMKNLAQERKKNAELPRRSMLWSDSSGMQQATSGMSQVAADRDLMGNSMMDGSDSMGVSRSGMKERSASVGVAPVRAAARVHHVSSAPEIRAPGSQTNMEAAKEPRVFGTAATTLNFGSQQTGVRCGGFQRLDWPAHNARPQQSSTDKGEKKRSRPNDSREKHSTSTGSAQPL